MNTPEPKNKDGKMNWGKPTTTVDESHNDLAPNWLSYHYGKMMIGGVMP